MPDVKTTASLQRRFARARRWMFAVVRPLWASFRDLLPILAVVGLFQLFVFGKPFEDAPRLIAGMGLIVLGLTLFVVGLEIGLFPIGEQLAFGLAKKGSVLWLLLFAFTLGFGTTLAEPALIAIANKAAAILAASHPEGVDPSRYAFALRFTVAVSVGTALAIGAVRIILGWPVHWFILAGYVLVLLLTPFAPRSIQALAYDSGGVTTSTITVPLTTALGVGLASSIKGRNALQDGFGLIALASVMPILFVLLFGIAWQ